MNDLTKNELNTIHNCLVNKAKNLLDERYYLDKQKINNFDKELPKQIEIELDKLYEILRKINFMIGETDEL